MGKSTKVVIDPDGTDFTVMLDESPTKVDDAAQCRKVPFLRKKVLDYIKEVGLASDIKAVLAQSGEAYGEDEKKLVASVVFTAASLFYTEQCRALVNIMLARARAMGHSEICDKPDCPVQILMGDDHPIHKLERIKSPAAQEHLPSVVNYNPKATSQGEA